MAEVKKIWLVIRMQNGNVIQGFFPDCLRTYQTLVDGPIEVYPIEYAGKEGLIVCNEEGKLRGDMKFNFSTFREQFFGDVCFVGCENEEFKDCPWSLDQIKDFTKGVSHEV